MRRQWAALVLVTVLSGCSKASEAPMRPAPPGVEAPAPVPAPVPAPAPAPSPGQPPAPAPSLDALVSVRVKGVGLGSSRGEVEALLGAPREVGRTAFGEVLQYPGLVLSLNGGGRVYRMEVLPEQYAALGFDPAAPPRYDQVAGLFGKPELTIGNAYLQFRRENVMAALYLHTGKLDRVVLEELSLVPAPDRSGPWGFMPEEEGYRWTYRSDKAPGEFSFTLRRTTLGWYVWDDGYDRKPIPRLLIEPDRIIDTEADMRAPVVLGTPPAVGQNYHSDPVGSGPNGRWDAEVVRKESVTVPAGTYRDALVVHASYQTFPADNGGPTYFTYWFAPGAGLVKWVYEPGKEPGYKETWELLSGRKP